MIKRRGPHSPGWRAFLGYYTAHIAASTCSHNMSECYAILAAAGKRLSDGYRWAASSSDDLASLDVLLDRVKHFIDGLVNW